MSDLKPSRELDALVAEKVFGWRKYQKYYSDGYESGYGDGWIDDKGKEVRGGLPNYSTNIPDAWKVVNRVELFAEATEFYLNRDYEGIWHAIFVGFGSQTFKAGYASDTKEMAICLAALEVMKNKV